MGRFLRISIVVTALLLTMACFLTECGSDNNNNTLVTTPAVLSLIKQAQPTTYTAAGQTITYSYLVTNNTTTSLPGPVKVQDNKITGITCPDVNTIGNKNGNLDTGESVTCTIQYVTTQADVDNTFISNTALATAGNQTSAPSSITIRVPLNPVLKLTVSPSPNAFSGAGQNIAITYAITNVGTTNLGPGQFIVRDSLFPNTITCGTNITLTPNQTTNCPATVYTTTQADVTAGKIVSNATASGAGAGTPQPVVTTIPNSSTPITTVVPITPGSMVTHVVITGDWLLQISRCYGASFPAVETANPQVVDPDLIYPARIVNVPNVGSTGTIYGPPCMVWYTVVSGDTWQSIADKYNADVVILKAANPKVANPTPGIKIKVPVNSKGGPPVTAAPPIPTTSVPPNPVLKLTVAPNPTVFTAAGQVINFSYTITNVGTTNLGPAQFVVQDNLIPSIPCPANVTLAPNQAISCNAGYTTTQADVTAGKIVSSASASGANAVTPQPTVTTIPFGPIVPTTPPPPQATRITFPPGNPTSAKQTGTITTPGTIRYVFTASAGQVLTVKLTVPTNDVSLGINAPNGTALKPLDTNNSWSGLLGLTGDYNLDLVSSVGSPAKPYTLDLSLNTPITTAPTGPAQRVADIYPGSGSSNPSYLSAFNGQLYFQANGNNGAGEELWKYDRGTNAATIVYDVFPGSGSSKPTSLRPYQNLLYFGANGNDNAGIELWRFNGSAVGRVNDLFVGPESSNPMYMTEFNGELYFSANGNNGAGVELWKFNGSTSATTMAFDINPGPGNSNPSYLAVYNGALYFAATTTNGGTELWKFDGTTANLAADLTPGAGNGNPAFLAVLNNFLYFSANGNNGAGTELWKFDGTTASMAADINPGPNDSAPTYMTLFNNALFFGANGNSSGFELWKFDGTTASMAADINPTGSSNPAYLAVYNNELYFQAEGNDGTGIELWKYNGP